MAVTGRERPSGWYLTPAVTFFGVFAVLPMVLVVYLSFTAWDGFGFPALSGAGNWSRLLSDPEVRHSLGLTFVFMVLGWVVQTPIALLIGVWAAGHQRNRAVLSSLFFLPVLLSTAAIALLWNSVLDPNFGLTRHIPLLDRFNFLGDSSIAIYAVAWVLTWQYVPFHTLLYQSAARGIPTSIYEAATIDGATPWQRFRYVTFPMLTPIIAVVMTFSVLFTFTDFQLIYVLTRGGPLNATHLMATLSFQRAIPGGQLGEGAALATMMVPFLLAAIMFSYFGLQRRGWQQGGDK